ncbi:hypothetical protein HN592_02935 [Candidatus Woesearchaeota archaeon]|nr:hypothetical protein [Candidatus Woesearchaeota archaeon]MBT4368168.1 hypothetical protein [Candidatus Woesearchaeota archaeon]MBT4712656.1 hypothetical protein [Candidatus Woesearchaeota archaeon]MBT6639569.1 hypothetical protein [Candidatus Woesearchaeota archaeon]MBT7133741.1 hypothetical protein [Candidatus Woesearchaeota archaeon]
MKKTTLILGIAILALLSVGFVMAMPFAKDAETKDALRTAVENNDFDSWKALMEAEITEENFNLMVEHHAEMGEFREAMDAARESGDFETIRSLKEGMKDNLPEEMYNQFRMKHKGMQKGNCPFSN